MGQTYTIQLEDKLTFSAQKQVYLTTARVKINLLYWPGATVPGSRYNSVISAVQNDFIFIWHDKEYLNEC